MSLFGALLGQLWFYVQHEMHLMSLNDASHAKVRGLMKWPYEPKIRFFFKQCIINGTNETKKQIKGIHL